MPKPPRIVCFSGFGCGLEGLGLMTYALCRPLSNEPPVFKHPKHFFDPHYNLFGQESPPRRRRDFSAQELSAHGLGCGLFQAQLHSSTHRPQGSSFLGLPYRILNMNPKSQKGTTLGPMGSSYLDPKRTCLFRAPYDEFLL